MGGKALDWSRGIPLFFRFRAAEAFATGLFSALSIHACMGGLAFWAGNFGSRVVS